MGEGSSVPRPAVVAAREALLASRASLDEEIVRLEASARAAVDIPAKIRRSPVKAAGLAAGAGFIVVGGPKRVLRRVKRAIRGPEEPLPASMLPGEIDKVLRSLGSDGEKVRGTIEREFADYLESKAPERRTRDVTAVLLSLLVGAGRGFAIRGGRQLAQQLLSNDPEQLRLQMEKIRARRSAQGLDEGG